jgi:hypothetical protein
MKKISQSVPNHPHLRYTNFEKYKNELLKFPLRLLLILKIFVQHLVLQIYL